MVGKNKKINKKEVNSIYEELYKEIVNEVCRQTSKEQQELKMTTSLLWHYKLGEDFALESVKVQEGGKIYTAAEDTLETTAKSFEENKWDMEDIAYIKYSKQCNGTNYYVNDYWYVLIVLESGMFYKIYLNEVDTTYMSKKEYNEFTRLLTRLKETLGKDVVYSMSR